MARFDAEVLARVPHVEEGRVVRPTPLVDITDDLIECGKAEYGLGISKAGVRVFAKLDSKIEGGSVKVRPAVAIIRDAIATGRLVKGQTVFEATSGNFGLALAGIGKLGLDVDALVSRRLQQRDIDQLQRDGAKLVNLDIDVCPAPGLKGAEDALVAKSVAASVRQQMEQLGFDPAPFDGVREEAERLLARQDAIGLAKLLARAYGGFCPEQYDNDRNVEVHRTLTGPELEGQLREAGSSLREADFVCAFGTGGTALGIGSYISSEHNRRGVRVVFPLAGQDVAGIRTKEKAIGLKFYEPRAYVGEHEVDFEEASRVFEFFNRKGYDIGESGALALYACMELVNYGAGKKFVVMVADGASKYVSEVKAVARKGKRDQVRLEEAASSIEEYGSVVLANKILLPSQHNLKIKTSALGCPEDAIKVADVRDVQAVLNGGEPSEEFDRLLPADDRPMLIVCLGGNTSLMLAKVLERKGVAAESLVGGITGLPASRGRQPFDLVQMARP